MILRATAVGKKMAELRIAKGLSMRDVFEISREIGRVRRNRAFLVGAESIVPTSRRVE